MRYLFQGDSITDTGRSDYQDLFSTGSGYVRLLEAELCCNDKDCEVLNGGISGNRVLDLLARWKKDCLLAKPDVLTILIGVNDVWREFGDQSSVDAGLYEEVYRILLRETKTALPDVRLILMGAYVCHGPATDENWEACCLGVGVRRDITRRLAKEFGAEFIDLQSVFDEAEKRAPISHWTGDGVHPTAAGHKLIAEAWKKKIPEFLS